MVPGTGIPHSHEIAIGPAEVITEERLNQGFRDYAWALVLDAPSVPEIPDIIDDIEDGIENGTIIGVGPGNSADKKVNTLLNMLINAQELIDAGLQEEGCQQLMDVYAKCDGLPKPPDFIEGDDAQAVADLILDLLDYYGCEI